MRYLQNLAMLAALSAVPSGWAASASTADLLACMKVGDDAQRLACFDRQAAALVAAQGRLAAAAPPAPPKLTPEQKIGLTRDKVEKLETAPDAPPAPEIKNFTAAISGVSGGAGGRQIFELDNGQVWRQSETKAFDVHVGDTVRVSKAALGSFFMELQSNKHVATRVSRVR
jgi:hypothetical protein